MQNLLAFGEQDIDAIEQGSGLARINSFATFLNANNRFSLVTLITFVAGAAFVIYLVFGGFKLMTSAGDPKAVAEAKQTMTNALIGLIIVLGAYWIVRLVGIVLGLQGIVGTGGSFG